MPPIPTIEQDGQAIRSLREARGLTVNQMAERIGLSPAHLRNIELGHKGLTKPNAFQICRVLRVQLSEIQRTPTCGDQ